MDNDYILGPDGELYHHGIKGMRWGVRRYQTKNGALTPAGRKRYDKDMAKIKAETQKLRNEKRTETKLSKLAEAKKKLRALKKGKEEQTEKEEAAKTAEEIAAKKIQILQSRDPKQISNNASLFTYDELNAAYMRLTLERNIKNLQPPEVDKGKQFVDKAITNANTISNVLDSGSKAWNSVAKIYNSLYGDKHGMTVPTISEKTTSALDKYKSETEKIKAKNERKKAEAERDGTKSELETYKDETARIKAEADRMKAEDTLRRYREGDFSDGKKKKSSSDSSDDSGGSDGSDGTRDDEEERED